jgi:hypothetical protein
MEMKETKKVHPMGEENNFRLAPVLRNKTPFPSFPFPDLGLKPERHLDFFFAGFAGKAVSGREVRIVLHAELTETNVLLQRHFFLRRLLYLSKVWKIKHCATP